MTKVLSKHICQVIFTINKIDFDMTHSNDIANVMISDVNIFRSFFSHRIRHNKDQSLIITTDGYSIKIKTNLL